MGFAPPPIPSLNGHVRYKVFLGRLPLSSVFNLNYKANKDINKKWPSEYMQAIGLYYFTKTKIEKQLQYSLVTLEY